MATKYASISAWLPFEVDFLDAFIPSDWIISYSTKSIEIEKISFLQSSSPWRGSSPFNQIWKFHLRVSQKNKNKNLRVSPACCKTSWDLPAVSSPSARRWLQIEHFDHCDFIIISRKLPAGQTQRWPLKRLNWVSWCPWVFVMIALASDDLMARTIVPRGHESQRFWSHCKQSLNMKKCI